MSEKNIKLVHKLYSIAITVALVAIAILFILNGVGLFSSDGEIMTSATPLSGEEIRALIGQRLLGMIVPIIIVVLLIILGGAIDIFIQIDEKREKPSPDSYRTLNIMLRRHKDSLYKKEDREKIHKERKFRLYFTLSGICLFLISITYPLIYAFGENSVTASGNANEEVMVIMLLTLIFLIPTVVYAIAIGILFNKSRLRECELLRSGVNRDKADDSLLPLTNYTASGLISRFISRDLSKLLKLIFVGLIAFLSILFIILGVINGGMTDVLNKAVNICRECIGLG